MLKTFFKFLGYCFLCASKFGWLCTFTGQSKWPTKNKYRRTAVVAEWLRRLTRNQFPSGSVGSNPTDCEIFSAFISAVEVISTISTFWWGTTTSLEKSINLVHMDFLGQNIFNLLGLRQGFNIASIVGSVVECSPATRAARVRFPDDANIFLHFLHLRTSFFKNFSFPLHPYLQNVFCQE